MTRITVILAALIIGCNSSTTSPVDCPNGETEWGWSYMDSTGVLYKAGGCASFAVIDSIMAACLTGQCTPTDTIGKSK